MCFITDDLFEGGFIQLYVSPVWSDVNLPPGAEYPRPGPGKSQQWMGSINPGTHTPYMLVLEFCTSGKISFRCRSLTEPSCTHRPRWAGPKLKTSARRCTATSLPTTQPASCARSNITYLLNILGPKPAFGRLGLGGIVRRVQFSWVHFSRLASRLRRSAGRGQIVL